jgi:hypothetical protein
VIFSFVSVFARTRLHKINLHCVKDLVEIRLAMARDCLVFIKVIYIREQLLIFMI